MEEGEGASQPQLSYGSVFNALDSSLLVNNEGSIARDHLSNERNFLAWLRLSITLIVIGEESSYRALIPPSSLFLYSVSPLRH